MMDIISGIKDMQKYSELTREDGLKIGFVPTMGSLHKGHMSLVNHAKHISDRTVVSIFVNPTQFGPNEDYNDYPRNFEDDADKLLNAGVDILFAPYTNEIYGSDYQTYVEVIDLQRYLCGQFRPGHFRGVTTIVLKLFNIVKPHYAVFGEKDYQQLQIIKKMVEDLNLDVEVKGYPLVREEDGLAMSSRNRYLTVQDREKAKSISRALFQIKQNFDKGVNGSSQLCSTAQNIMSESSITDIDYVSIVDNKLLKDKETASSGDVAATAVRIGGARLIDNIKL